MDHDNIFEIAFNAKYGKYGDEDLLTDLFAWYLRQDTEIAQKIVELFSGIYPSTINEILTQPNFTDFPENNPDMIIKTPQVHVICEHKVGSGLGERQLERYLETTIAEEAKCQKSHCLVFLARDLIQIPIEVRQSQHYRQLNNVAHFRWRDISEVVLNETILQPNSKFHFLRIQYLQCLRYLNLVHNYLPGGYDSLFSSDPEMREARQAQEADFGDAWKVINGTIEWFNARKYGFAGGSRKELYIEASDHSEISTGNGLKHLHLSPIEVAKDMPKSIPFQPPYLKCYVSFTGSHPIVKEKMSQLSPAILNTISLPVFCNKGKNETDPFRFLMPLSPIIETQQLAETLSAVATELYETAILPAFDL